VLAVYFMMKYNWSLFKTLEFLNSRRPDLEIRASFIHQLSEFEKQLSSQASKTKDWNELASNDNLLENEEYLL
jgi:hypothetical protein